MITFGTGRRQWARPVWTQGNSMRDNNVPLQSLLTAGARRIRCCTAALTLLAAAAPAAAQDTLRVRLGTDLFAGGEAEQYLRYLQTTGEVAPYPWSVRGFGPAEADRLLPPVAGHPWADHLAVQRDTVGAAFRVLPVDVRMAYNSAFPFAMNDGPVWAGRGVTTSVEAGVAFRAGPLSLVLAPTVFWAENRDFELRPNGRPGELAFGDGFFPGTIDAPQRFGDRSFGRIDPGQSSIRLDAGKVALGVSTANQVWGPGGEEPLILGNAGPGFLHSFAGTSSPVNVGVGRVHGRVVYGRLDQSAYSSIQEGSRRRRFMSGIVGVMQPRGITGLEVGASRFFHTPWPEQGLRAARLLKPLEGILKKGVRGEGSPTDPLSDVDNQLASVFFRWVAAPAGFEVYGEYAREDHNYDLRDLTLEPDHNSAYMLGLRRAWRASPERMVAVRAEVMDARVTRLARIRYQAPFHIHAATNQGHTQLGQALGGRAVHGGAGSFAALDLYHRRGRWTGYWLREERGASGEGWHGRPQEENGGATVWVAHGAGVESVFRAGRMEMRAGLTGVLELNRYLESRNDFNLNAQFGVRYTP